MLTTIRATIRAIRSADAHIVHLDAVAEQDSAARSAVAYPRLTGPIAVGDRVVLNTTATTLGLGTGGVDFVVVNESLATTVFGEPDGTEHVMKLRYTPEQFAVRAAETDPALAAMWERETSLRGTPVVVCGLHSQIAPVAAGIKALRPNARVAYLMTDAAALPLAFSQLVRSLRQAGLIDATLTAGQAFGGGYECVTEASGLIAARFIANADVIIVGQGPGNAGTGTRYGFSGIEQGPLIDLTYRLGGDPIGVLRLSFADPRERHRGLSHHSVTSLGLLSTARCRVAFPARPEGVLEADYRLLHDHLLHSPIGKRHSIEEADGMPALALLAERGIAVTSMGRSVTQDPIGFHAAAAAGAIAAGLIVNGHGGA